MKRQAAFCESKALFSLRSGSTEGYEGPLLNFESIEKILACLPARECWLIGTQLSKRFSQWTKSAINIYCCFGLDRSDLFRLQTQFRFKNDETKLSFCIYENSGYYRVQENYGSLMVPTESRHRKVPRIVGTMLFNLEVHDSESYYFFDKNITVIERIRYKIFK